MKKPLLSEDNKGYMGKIMSVSSIGIEMGAAVGVGVFVGYVVDYNFGTDPVAKIIGFFFGIAAAALCLYKAILRIKKIEMEADEE